MPMSRERCGAPTASIADHKAVSAVKVKCQNFSEKSEALDQIDCPRAQCLRLWSCRIMAPRTLEPLLRSATFPLLQALEALQWSSLQVLWQSSRWTSADVSCFLPAVFVVHFAC